MPGDLAEAVEQVRILDTHEHVAPERDWIESGPDVLQDLFFNYYASADLEVGGASAEAVARMLDPEAGDLASRFEGIRPAWEAMRHTGYGEGVSLMASRLYGLEELTPAGLEAAQVTLEGLRRPGERFRLLSEVAGLDHVQIDPGQVWPPPVERDEPEFFLYDLSWWRFCNGEIEAEKILRETGIEVRGLEDLRAAMAAIFARFAPATIAVKSPHAYVRTLHWQERSDEEAARALAEVLAGDPEVMDGMTRLLGGDLRGGGVEESARIVLGDWCLARGVELAIEHDLPFKIHTGYLAGTGQMPLARTSAANLCGLLDRYREARFVLMHISYPHSDELLAIAKHFPNVWVDLCWAWSLDPFTTGDFVRRFLHAVPASKLFAFGGDADWPTTVVGFAAQARRWLTRTLEAEVTDGYMSEAEAIKVANRVLRENQLACFDIEATRAAARERAAAPATK